MLKWKPVTYNEPVYQERILFACDNGETYAGYRASVGDFFSDDRILIADFGSRMSLLPKAKYWLPFPECPLVKSKPTTLDEFIR